MDWIKFIMLFTLGGIIGITVPYTVYRIIILHQRRVDRLEAIEANVRSLLHADRANKDEWLLVLARVTVLEKKLKVDNKIKVKKEKKNDTSK